MNLLSDGKKMEAVFPTDLTRKLTIDGKTASYPVYRVRLDLLYFNDKNGRIATWMSQYKAEHSGNIPSFITERESYNDLIQDFIVKSNPEAIKSTRQNIELVDQREPGVVLSDGRIVDGNRRYACLRQLAAGDPRFNFFEAVILERDIDKSEKTIKMLELSIQYGEEEKVVYNPVDKLVSIYNDIIDTKLLSISEYALSANEDEKEIAKKLELAKLMVEFLEFINAPKQYYIARDLQITFPLEELQKMMKQCKSEDQINDVKNCVFTNILMSPTGDMTRFVRRIKDVVSSEYVSEFISEQLEIAGKVLESLPQTGQVTEKIIREKIRRNTDLSQDLEHSIEKAHAKVKKTETRNRPAQIIEKSVFLLESIDINILQKLSEIELKRVLEQLKKLDEIVADIRDKAGE